MPTATIASKWSRPPIGCPKPDAKPETVPAPVWASAGVAAKTAMAKATSDECRILNSPV